MIIQNKHKLQRVIFTAKLRLDKKVIFTVNLKDKFSFEPYIKGDSLLNFTIVT